MSRDYDHIKEYIESDLNEDVRLLISDFAILWNNYEHYLFTFGGEPNYSFYQLKKDGGVFSRRIVKKINNDIESKIILYCNELLKYYKKRKNVEEINLKDLIDFFSIRIIENGNKRGEFETIKDFENLFFSNSINDKYLFILLIVGRVRNNMFHGIKELKSLNEQKELFEICNKILTMTLSITDTLVFV